VRFGRSKSRSFDKGQLIVSRELARQPQKWLLKVVVRLGGNIIILEVFLAVEGNLLRLDLAILDLDLVSAQDDGDVLADARQVAVPVGNVLVRDARRDIEHDNGALALDVVSVTKSAKLFLSGRVPHVELDRTAVGVENERVDFDAERRNVLFLELSGKMALDKGRFTDASVSDKDEFEFWSTLSSL